MALEVALEEKWVSGQNIEALKPRLPSPGSQAQGSSAWKKSSHKIWMWKSVKIIDELDRGLQKF